ncbi:hypothetical protein VKT23_013937 [Stygiomarasmius scandens]|uniref:HNH nuclease domain-containing protein n=1 Tax=Marasmiellus scandens TaxID=2682957 RepID=A0ABR1J1H5_9AGAR
MQTVCIGKVEDRFFKLSLGLTYYEEPSGLTPSPPNQAAWSEREYRPSPETALTNDAVHVALTPPPKYKHAIKLDKNTLERLESVIPMIGRCIIICEEGRSPGNDIQHAHVIPRFWRKLESLMDVIAHMLGIWEFHLNTRGNIILMQSGLHSRFDHGQFILLPSDDIVLNHVLQCMDQNREATTTENLLKQVDLIQLYKFKETDFTLVPIRMQEDRSIFRQNVVLQDSSSNMFSPSGGYTEFEYPFTNLTISSHLNPALAVIHAANFLHEICESDEIFSTHLTLESIRQRSVGWFSTIVPDEFKKARAFQHPSIQQQVQILSPATTPDKRKIPGPLKFHKLKKNPSPLKGQGETVAVLIIQRSVRIKREGFTVYLQQAALGGIKSGGGNSDTDNDTDNDSHASDVFEDDVDDWVDTMASIRNLTAGSNEVTSEPNLMPMEDLRISGPASSIAQLLEFIKQEGLPLSVISHQVNQVAAMSVGQEPPDGAFLQPRPQILGSSSFNSDRGSDVPGSASALSSDHCEMSGDQDRASKVFLKRKHSDVED